MPAPRQTVLSQLYRDFSGKISHKIFGKVDTPWMKSKEQDIILEILERLQPANCLEWGSGFSTVAFPDLVRGLKTWHSIEHNSEWHQEISSKVVNDAVELHLVKADNPNFGLGEKRFSEKMDGLYEDFKTYIEFPETLDTLFDFIFIDGRARKECLRKSYNLLSDRGIVIVHDANRDIYFEGAPAFESFVKFQDYRKARKLGGIWVGRKSGSVQDFLDETRHSNLWKGHDKVARTLFLK